MVIGIIVTSDGISGVRGAGAAACLGAGAATLAAVCAASLSPGSFGGGSVDSIAVVSVNDAFVMGAWAKDTGAADKIDFLADGSAAFAKAAGLDLDLTARGMGVRVKRFSALVDNGVVKSLAIEENPGIELTGADAMLKNL